MTLTGTAMVGVDPVLVLQDVERDTLFQNQSRQSMLIARDGDFDAYSELAPFGSVMIPAGSDPVYAMAPRLNAGAYVRLFYSEVEELVFRGR